MWCLPLFFLLVGASYAAEVCYDELGCFDDQAPWGGTAQRPTSALPWTPDQINTRFLLFTQRNKYYQEIKPDSSAQASNYNGAQMTRFILPGYLQKEEETWPQEMCRNMVSWENVNCVAVEWTNGVKTNYAQAVNNARVVGAQVAHMVLFLMSKFKQTPARFHLIGHSVGAHAAGDVGQRIPGLARITGLDPIEPYFKDTDARVRLDTSDAAFVDVIHTDALPFDKKLGLGIPEPLGHIDFYPNGGELMPGCSANSGRVSDLDAIWEGTKKFDACNHARAHHFYSESIVKPLGFAGYSCASADSFSNGECFPCQGDSCPLMGHRADRFPLDGVSQTKFFLNTGASAPFGRYSYKVTLTLDGAVWPNPGFMYVALSGAVEKTEEVQLYVGTLMPGWTYDKLVDSEVDLGDVTEVQFRWRNHIWNPMKPKYGASKVEVQRGHDKKMFFLCATENVNEDVVQSILPCPQ